MRNPSRAVGIHYHPIAIAVQVADPYLDVIGQVLAALVGEQVCVAPVIPFIPLISLLIEGYQMSALVSGSYVNQFSPVQADREILVFPHQLSLPHYGIRRAVFEYVESIDTGLCRVKCRRGSTDLESNMASHCQGCQTEQNPDLDQILTKGEEFHIRALGEAQYGSLVDLDLRPTVITRVKAITRLQSQVRAGRIPVRVSHVLEADSALEVGQPSDPKVLLARQCEASRQDEGQGNVEKFPGHDSPPVSWDRTA
jgi:hypothetical protein